MLLIELSSFTQIQGLSAAAEQNKGVNRMIIKADLKRIVSGWQFYAAILCGLALFTHPVLLNRGFWEYASPLELFSMAMGVSDFTPFAVIFAVLPYGTAFCMDCKSEYANSIVSRIGIRKYTWGRWASVALSGAMVMGFLMLGTVTMCLTGAKMPETEMSASFLKGGPWENLPLLMNGFWFYLLRICLAMLFGSLWATVGLIVSAVAPNPYVVLILPFVIYQGAWYLLGLSIFNPIYYFRADFQGIPSLAFSFGYQILWNAMAALAAQVLMRRRLRR